MVGRGEVTSGEGQGRGRGRAETPGREPNYGRDSKNGLAELVERKKSGSVLVGVPDGSWRVVAGVRDWSWSRLRGRAAEFRCERGGGGGSPPH